MKINAKTGKIRIRCVDENGMKVKPDHRTDLQLLTAMFRKRPGFVRYRESVSGGGGFITVIETDLFRFDFEDGRIVGIDVENEEGGRYFEVA